MAGSSSGGKAKEKQPGGSKKGKGGSKGGEEPKKQPRLYHYILKARLVKERYVREFVERRMPPGFLHEYHLEDGVWHILVWEKFDEMVFQPFGLAVQEIDATTLELYRP